MSNKSALDALVRGPQSYFSVTLPEGYAARRYAGIFQKKLGLDSLNFMQLISDTNFIQKLGWEDPSLEGYLYPETYHFTYGVTEKQVIRTLVQQFRSTVPDSFWVAAEEQGMTRRDAVTLASIIEGEAMLDREMPLIASVYHNRLERDMRLQADPTIQYIIPESPRRLLNRDLKIDSPYNTYLYAGLPPGPINNPAVNAIRAAVYPAETSFLYFVADGKGGHTFSRTLTQHLNAKRKFDRIRREHRRKELNAQREE
ncbi:MAG: endolytic transglycosylase MltG [candidate division KSB1 bacterium]|nr:endolytic transglycosylase MltG [candidate division KSB1 bacterium]